MDNIYKEYFNKKHKNDTLTKEKKLNNLKIIKPAFGRTAYKFYDKIDNRDIGNSLYNNKL